MADAVKGAGSNFFIQLWHPGAIREVGADHEFAAQPSISPSGLIQKGGSERKSHDAPRSPRGARRVC